jgi:nicotinate-nucleotide pyrophosphorylase (carboxylating)
MASKDIKASISSRLSDIEKILPVDLRHSTVITMLIISLAEDLSDSTELEPLWPELVKGDITSQATILATTHLTGLMTAKAAGKVAGLPLAQAVFMLADSRIDFQAIVQDGAFVTPGTVLAEIHGPGQGLLLGERSALNFLGRLSGMATLTHKFVQAVAGTKAVILDTRKTAPGYRRLDKYAVRMGGGDNHRMGLFDMVIIKDNHIDGAGGIRPAVERVRQKYSDRYPIEVEVKNLDELHITLSLGVDRIMLDNMDLDTMRQAVQITAGRIPLEASGNVTLETVRAIAETGVDFISSGALTHSAPVLDISLRLR